MRINTSAAEINPYPNQQTTSSCLQLGAGAELASTQNVGAAIQIVPNTMAFRKGIVFGAESIEGTDGTSGLGVAIAMASFHSIDWYNNSNARVGRIYVGTSTANLSELRFTANGPNIFGTNGRGVCLFVDAASAVNSFQMVSSVTGAGPQLIATGTDTDVDFRLTCKGAGVVRFGTHSAIAAETVTGYITIKDSAGNLRKIAVVS